MESILDPDGVCLLWNDPNTGLALLEYEVDMPVDEKDLVYSLAAQVHHLSSDEDRRKTLQRIEEDFPELYQLVKKRVIELDAPDSIPPRRSGSGDGQDLGKAGKFIGSLDMLASTLRKNGVWGAIAILLFACGYMAWQLQEARERQEDLLREMIRMRSNRMEQNIVVGEGAHLERGAIMKGGAPSPPAL